MNLLRISRSQARRAMRCSDLYARRRITSDQLPAVRLALQALEDRDGLQARLIADQVWNAYPCFRGQIIRLLYLIGAVSFWDAKRLVAKYRNSSDGA